MANDDAASIYLANDLIAAGKLAIGDGYRAKNSELTSVGIPFARAGNINGGFHFEGADHFPVDDLGKVGDKISRPGDVVFTSKGTVGRLAYVRTTTPRFVYAPQLCFWRSLDHDHIDDRWLYYWMSALEFRTQMMGVKGQTDMADYVSLSDQRRMEITLPHIDTQRAIAAVLGALDDKIEQNQRTGRALERLARATFKAWFVNFEPVKAKAAGQTTFPSMSPAAFAALPARFIDSEVGPVPEGWAILPLEDCISHLIDHRGKTPKKLGGDWSQHGIPALSAKNVKAGRIIRAELKNFVDDEMFRRWMPVPLLLNDIVMTSEAPLGELVCLARSADYCLSQRVFGIRANRDVVEPSYLYRFLQSDDAQAQLAGRASGTTVIGIRQSELRRIAVPVAPIRIQKASAEVLQVCADLAAQLDESTEKLAALRDYLLPQLFSGRIRVGVPDA